MAYRRSIFLIDRPFQYRFALYVCSWLFALSFIYPLLIYSLFDYFLAHMALDPRGPTIKNLENARETVILLLGLLQLLFLAITFLISIFMSHRIAGPLYKLRKFLKDAASGNLEQDLYFRKNDHFKDVAAEYNLMTAGIRRILKKDLDSAQASIQRLEALRSRVSGPIKAELDEVITALREVTERSSVGHQESLRPTTEKTAPPSA